MRYFDAPSTSLPAPGAKVDDAALEALAVILFDLGIHREKGPKESHHSKVCSSRLSAHLGEERLDLS